MDEGQLPISIEDVEPLVQQLYQPGAPEKIARIQETLHRLQRGPNGWQIAQKLMGSADEKAKFFGALTYTVKLNTDCESLSSENAGTLLQNLVGWLIQCLDNNVGALVVRKLCSTLVTYFLHFAARWAKCIKHLLYCLSIRQAVPYEALENAPDTSVLQKLSDQIALAVIWVATGLVDEVGKTDSTSMKQFVKSWFLRSMNVDDIVATMANYIENRSKHVSNPRIRQDSMKCLQAWAHFSGSNEEMTAPLRTLTEPAMECLMDDDLFEVTAEFLSHMLTNYSKFLREEDFKLLQSVFESLWSQERYSRLIKGDFDFDSLQFGQLMLDYADVRVAQLSKNAGTDPRVSQFLSVLVGLLSAKGLAVHEDKIFVPALEFWSEFLFDLSDFAFTEDNRQHPAWVTAALPFVMQAFEMCWLKIQFPPADMFNSWDSADQAAFKDARRDVGDILEQMYMLIGDSLLSTFTNLLLLSVQKEDLGSEMEAAMFCLSRFPDCVKHNEEDPYLSKIFASNLFQLLTSRGTEVPKRTRQSFFDLIDGYAGTDYFQRHTEYLPPALNFMASIIGSPTLGRIAANSVYRLCSCCREVLIPELATFLQQYVEITKIPNLNGQVKETFMGAISFIIQALPDNMSKVAPLQQMLNFVETDQDESLRILAAELNQKAVTISENFGTSYPRGSELAVQTLRCLSKIGLGLRVPDHTPIDLEKESRPNFWVKGDGAPVQQRIIKIVFRISEAVSNHGEVVEEACCVFRAGFTEHDPGPFVLPPELMVEFLLKFGLGAPRVGSVMSTACALISSLKKTSERIDEVAAAVLGWNAQLLLQLGEPSRDPEVAQHGIDLVHRLVPKYLNVLLNHQPPSSLENLFVFTLMALGGSDPLSKYSAAEFWASFISIKNQEDQVQTSIDTGMQHLGPLFTLRLVHNIGGGAARSELDKLCEPLKKLVVNQVQAKSWLQLALLDDNFPSDKVTAKDKLTFLQKIINLRGAKGTNQIVREFWLSCRGSIFAYTS